MEIPVTGEYIYPMDELLKKVRKFNKDRDWGKFHTPRNLAISLSLEASEVLEKFQWKLDDSVSKNDKQELEEELADVLLYLINIADRLEIDLMAAAAKKITKNAEKYPVEKSKGRSTKYTRL